MRHASFFSGVGGLDLGFERSGITTVSVSEIDPYASSVLAERFPDAPNLGDITKVNADDIPEADIWSGGFPCQDLSVAGKRAGFAGKRSSLAFTFLDLVERRRPRWIVLENVPGLFSSNNGADFGRLLHEMEQLGYGVSWRTLDARYFGVPQRRRRVFIIGSLESDRSAEVLLECNGCERHPAPSQPQGKETTRELGKGAHVAGAIAGRFGKRVNSTADEPLNIIASPDPDGVRTADGISRRMDNQQHMATATSYGQYQMTNVAGTLRANGGDAGGGSENILSFPSRFGSNANVTENQAQSMAHSAGAPAVLRKLESAHTADDDDALLPQGIDSHRYRCCGNGVVTPVAEWIGRRIVKTDKQWNERSGT
jgi:DNA-cytosine methyltransferase